MYVCILNVCLNKRNYVNFQLHLGHAHIPFDLIKFANNSPPCTMGYVIGL